MRVAGARSCASRPRRAAISSRTGFGRLARTVEAQGAPSRRSCARASTATPLRSALARIDVDRARLDLDRRDRRPAQPRRRDRQHARSRAPVADRAGGRLAQQQLEADPRRRVRAGAEVHARVDHEVVPATLDPRRPHHQVADPHGAQVLVPAALPAVRAPARRGRRRHRSAPGSRPRAAARPRARRGRTRRRRPPPAPRRRSRGSAAGPPAPARRGPHARGWRAGSTREDALELGDHALVGPLVVGR